MPESSHDEINTDFIKELKGYLPTLRQKAGKLHALGPDDSGNDLIELHRLVHTIRGASSLIKLNNLSQVASELEEVVEQVINKNLASAPVVLNAITQAIDYFDAYSEQTPVNDGFDQNSQSEVLSSLLNVRKLATASNENDMLSQLLETIGELEDDGADTAAENLQVQDNTDFGETLMGDKGESESIDPLQQELQKEFYNEAEDHFQDLGQALGKLEDHINAPAKLTPDHKELLRLIRRSIHTIKGAAAVVKLKAIAGWGHEVEDVLDYLYDEADAIAPEQIKVITKAVDILERFMVAPQRIDPGQLAQLRVEFKRIIHPERASAGDPQNEPDPEGLALSFEFVESIISDEQPGQYNDDADKNLDGQIPALDGDASKTMRVDLAKVESVVNLAAESTIALTAFDRDMEGLDDLIGEIDRARQQLNRTARDLERGYEVKAIQQMGNNQPLWKSPLETTKEKSEAFEDFDVLELDRYSELNLMIRSLAETAVDVSTISRQLSNIHSGFETYLNRLRIVLSDLHQKTMRMRMAPMATIINRMRRTVRETAVQLDKQVRLTIHGTHIELDKTVWEKLADPLMHMLRNAIDHGIETRDIRQKAGKPEIATINLVAFYQGNQVVLRVTDDGAGFDYNAIREAVASSQPESDVDAISEENLANIIFRPGFSTRRTISEVSGRGIGLDVVKENIGKLKGSVRVERTAKGTGTTFRIDLPLNMAAMQALLFDAGGRRYATAVYDIKEVLRADPKTIEGQTKKRINIDGRRLPFFQLSDILGHHASRSQTSDEKQWPLVLIVGSEPWQGAVAIERMYDQREIVIKNLGTHLHHVKGVSGATTLGDGMVVPILNLEELLKGEPAPFHLSGRKQTDQIQKNLEIMVVDDSVTVRKVIAHLIQQQGWEALTARDGMEAIERLHHRQPDLVILDIEMPRMNGFEFLRLIRAQDKFKALPVIMHTSRVSKKHREKSSALGANAFVAKPYDEQSFVALVKRLCGHR